MIRGAGAALALAVSACGGGDNGQPAPSAHRGGAELGRAAILAAVCSGCHAGPQASFASLDGLSADEIAGSMLAYRNDPQGQSEMNRIARGYSEADISAIAAYLAGETS